MEWVRANYSYIFHCDPQTSEKTQTNGGTYNINELVILTPINHRELLSLARGVDYDVNDGNLYMNDNHIIIFQFNLTSPVNEARDEPKIQWFFLENPEYSVASSFRDSLIILTFFIPQDERRSPMTFHYKTNYINVVLPEIDTVGLQNPHICNIDPVDMTRQYCEDARNVNIHTSFVGDRGQPDFVAARLYHENITAPICAVLDHLYESTQEYPIMTQAEKEGKVEIDQAHLHQILTRSHARIPFIYEINTHEKVCRKYKILSHDLVIPLLVDDDCIHLERTFYLDRILINYMIFIMCITNNVTSIAELSTCGVFNMVFDLYTRRQNDQVGYHYDFSPGIRVATVGLVYSMRPDQIKAGPQLIPLRLDRPVANLNVTPYGCFVKRGGMVLFNNAHLSHSTPYLDGIIDRQPYRISHIRSGIPNGNQVMLDVTHEPMDLPPDLIERLRQSSGPETARTFLRAWQITEISEEQAERLEKNGQKEYVVQRIFGGHDFDAYMNEQYDLFAEWSKREQCQHIQVDRGDDEQIQLPQIPGFVRGGRIGNSTKSTSKSRSTSKSMSHYFNLKHLKQFTKMRMHRSFSSHSMVKESVKSKFKQIKCILENPNENVMVYHGVKKNKINNRSYSVSHKKKHSAISRTRKVKSI